MMGRCWWVTAGLAVVFAAGVACAPGSASLASLSGQTPAGAADIDNDGIPDADDNCVEMANPDQTDVDTDGVGDACDDLVDQDGDTIADADDNCMMVENGDQADGDGDGLGDVCDNCPSAANAEQFDANSDGIGDACPCDVCDGAQWCEEHPGQEDVTCVADCASERQAADGKCCPIGSKAEDGECKLPDLYVVDERVTSSFEFENRVFNEMDCEYIEGCVNGTGMRTLLRFDTTTPNDGAGDLHLGDPAGFANFVFSSCHNHYHFESYAAYEVRDQAGNVVAPGHKQAFCLMDFEPWAPGVNWGDWQYGCDYQGISKGWADTYDSYLDCQFVDVTGVPPGDYTLHISVNHEKVIAEEDYTNNETSVPFTIP